MMFVHHCNPVSLHITAFARAKNIFHPCSHFTGITIFHYFSCVLKWCMDAGTDDAGTEEPEDERR